MLRFIVYRYISYKDSKISHASLLALRHHLSQLPPALLPTSQLHDQHLPYSTTRLSILDPPTLPMCTRLPIHYCALTCYTILSRILHTLHTRATRHTALPISPTDVPCHLYPIGSTIQPYLGHLYPPFSSDTFIGLIRPIAPISPTSHRPPTPSRSSPPFREPS